MNWRELANKAREQEIENKNLLTAAGRKVFLSSVLCCVFISSAMSAPDYYMAPKEQRDNAAKIAAQYRALADKIPAELYEIEGLADALDYDLDSAADYVAQRVAFDPYHGILRGPEGTLAANAGSAWDQAGLLVSLINTMGGDAMVVQGQLPTAETKRLLKGAFEGRGPFKSPLDAKTIQDAFADIVPAESLDAAEKSNSAANGSDESASFEQRVDSISKDILRTLQAQGVPVAESASTDRLLTELSESYAWVRYRESPNEPWKEVHPAFGAQAAPVVEATAYAKKQAPEEWVHYLSIELEIERRNGGAYSTESIIEPYQGTVASFATHQTTLEIGPNQAPSPGGDQAAYFVPVINGNLAPGAKAFTLLGTTAPADAAASGPDIFATVSGKLGSALGALNDATGTAEDTPRLTGVTLIITHTAPGGIVHEERRRLVDFRESMPDDPTRELLISSAIDVGTGRENGARDMRAVFLSNASFTTRIPYVAAVSKGEMKRDEVSSHPAFERDYDTLAWRDIRMLGDLLEPKATASTLVTRQSPLVVMTRLVADLDRNARMIQVIDIVHNQTMALQSEGSQVTIAPQGNLRQGVRETLAEGYLIGKNSDNTWFNSPLTEAISNSAGIETWARKNEATPGSTDRMAADLKQADVLLMSAFEPEPRWWRVNAQTGQTLGMGIYGGQEILENITARGVAKVVCGALTAGFFVIGAVGCQDAYADNPSMLACCHTGNAMLAVAGYGIAAKGTSQMLGMMAATGVLEAEVAVVMIFGEVAVDMQMAAAGLGVDPLCSAIVGD